MRIFLPAASYTGGSRRGGEVVRMKTVIYLDVLLLTNFLIAYGLL